MDVAQIAAKAWWAALQTRYEHDDVQFFADAIDDTPLPQDLFDSVVDNLLTNALRKRQSEPGVAVEVRLALQPLVSLKVTDSGIRCAGTCGAQSVHEPGGVGFRPGGGPVSGRPAGCAFGLSAGTARQSGGARDLPLAGYGEQSEPVGHTRTIKLGYLKPTSTRSSNSPPAPHRLGGRAADIGGVGIGVFQFICAGRRSQRVAVDVECTPAVRRRGTAAQTRHSAATSGCAAQVLHGANCRVGWSAGYWREKPLTSFE